MSDHDGDCEVSASRAHCHCDCRYFMARGEKDIIALRSELAALKAERDRALRESVLLLNEWKKAQMLDSCCGGDIPPYDGPEKPAQEGK